MTEAAGTRRAILRMIQVLLIPASDKRRCQVTDVEYSAAALSDAIGGGLLADLYYGDLTQHTAPAGARPGRPGRPGGADAAGRFCFYADEARAAKRLPGNPRADVLAARLGCIGDLRAIPLTGDVLVTGATGTNDDTDVPCGVLAAARSGGLLSADHPEHALSLPAREVNHP